MCDYSLHSVKTRDAAVGDKLVSLMFPGTITQGFADVNTLNDEGGPVAVCLRPGTELAFEEDVSQRSLALAVVREFPGQKVATFCQIDMDNPYTHHDAIKMVDGTVLKLQELVQNLRCTILKLPVDKEYEKQAPVAEDIAEAEFEDSSI